MFPATRYHWTLYVDPITSLILTLLILMTTLKVLKVPIMILLQTVPKNINLKQLSNELIQLCRDSYEVRRYFILPWPVLTFKWLLFKAEVNIHNLHVWTLTGNKVRLSARFNKGVTENKTQSQFWLSRSYLISCGSFIANFEPALKSRIFEIAILKISTVLYHVKIW